MIKKLITQLVIENPSEDDLIHMYKIIAVHSARAFHNKMPKIQ